MLGLSALDTLTDLPLLAVGRPFNQLCHAPRPLTEQHGLQERWHLFLQNKLLAQPHEIVDRAFIALFFVLGPKFDQE